MGRVQGQADFVGGGQIGGAERHGGTETFGFIIQRSGQPAVG
jgi:hypothetical protein